MKRKVLVLSVIFALFAMVTLPGSASAWWLTGTIDEIEDWGYSGVWGDAGVYISVDTGTYTCRRMIDGTLADGIIREILAMTLTAQSQTATVSYWVTGSPEVIISMIWSP